MTEKKKLVPADNKNNLFKKAVQAIHCSSALSFVELKLLNVLAKNAIPVIHSQDVFKMSVADAANGIKFNSNNTLLLKNGVIGLKEKSITWDEGGEFGITSFLAEARIKDGIIEYSFPPSVRHLFALKDGNVWALLDLDLIGKMKSAYTLKLYENCVRFIRVGTTGSKPVDWWRDKLQAIKPAYIDFRNFRRVIDESVDELNQISGYWIVPDYQKQGRNVVSILFSIREEKMIGGGSGDGSEDEDFSVDDVLLKMICALGVSDKVARGYLSKHEKYYIIGNLEVVEQTMQAGGIKKTPAAYLASALKDDYRVRKTADEIEREENSARKAVEAAAAAAAEREAKEKRLLRLS